MNSAGLSYPACSPWKFSSAAPQASEIESGVAQNSSKIFCNNRTKKKTLEDQSSETQAVECCSSTPNIPSSPSPLLHLCKIMAALKSPFANLKMSFANLNEQEPVNGLSTVFTSKGFLYQSWYNLLGQDMKVKGNVSHSSRVIIRNSGSSWINSAISLGLSDYLMALQTPPVPIQSDLPLHLCISSGCCIFQEWSLLLPICWHQPGIFICSSDLSDIKPFLAGPRPFQLFHVMLGAC